MMPSLYNLISKLESDLFLSLSLSVCMCTCVADVHDTIPVPDLEIFIPAGKDCEWKY